MSMHESGSRPHISLAVYNNVDVALLSERLYKFLIGRKTVKLRFESISAFPTDPAVIFIAPGMTNELFTLHKNYHALMSGCLKDEWGYYLPDKWVPHCALAMDVPKLKVSNIIQHLTTDFQQFDFSIEEIGIVEFRPVNHLITYKLTE